MKTNIGENSIRRKIIIVDSIPNVIIATQIRRTLYKDDYFICVMINGASDLSGIYEKLLVNRVFDEIYLADAHSINCFWKKAISLLNLSVALYMFLGTKFDFYSITDVFFWNPSNFLFVLLCYLKRHRQSYNLHIYCDAFGGYTVEAPGDPTYVFCNGVWDYLFREIYKPISIEVSDYDFYCFKPDICPFTRKHPVWEVPVEPMLGEEERKLLNDIFSYDESFSIKQRFIVLGNVPGEIKDQNESDAALRIISNIVPKDELVVKAHPRVKQTYYEAFGIDVIAKVFPFELYCLNNDIADKVVIADQSSSVFIPALIYGKQCTVIWLRNLLPGVNVYNDEMWNWFNSLMSKNGCTVFDVGSEEELICALKQSMG